MARAYSLDLRERIIARVQAGETVRAVAESFAISPSCVVKWTQWYRSTGSAAPGQMGGHVPDKIEGEHRQWLLERTARPWPGG